MKTIYIDVYFMINFTVDILAVFVASAMIHLKQNIKKLLLSGLLGAIFAVVELFISNRIALVSLAMLYVFSITLVSCKGISISRKVKFILSFYISAFLIGGAVDYIYGILDRYFERVNIDMTAQTNRKAIIFSLIILILIGVLRLFIMVFSQGLNEKSTKLRIELNEKHIEVEALIDTGNLVKDPMNMSPVVFLKRTSAEKLFPLSIIELKDIDNLSPSFKKRIRLIPVSKNSETHVVIGIKVDKVFVIKGDFKEEINVTIAIDKEEGTYGGFLALAPYIAVCNNA